VTSWVPSARAPSARERSLAAAHPGRRRAADRELRRLRARDGRITTVGRLPGSSCSSHDGRGNHRLAWHGRIRACSNAMRASEISISWIRFFSALPGGRCRAGYRAQVERRYRMPMTWPRSSGCRCSSAPRAAITPRRFMRSFARPDGRVIGSTPRPPENGRLISDRPRSGNLEVMERARAAGVKDFIAAIVRSRSCSWRVRTHASRDG